MSCLSPPEAMSLQEQQSCLRYNNDYRPHLRADVMGSFFPLFGITPPGLDQNTAAHDDSVFMNAFGISGGITFVPNIDLARREFHKIHTTFHVLSHITEDHAHSIVSLDKYVVDLSQNVNNALMSADDGRPESARRFQRIVDLEKRFEDFCRDYVQTIKAHLLNAHDFLMDLARKVGDVLVENATFITRLANSEALQARIEQIVNERLRQENTELRDRIIVLEQRIERMS